MYQSGIGHNQRADEVVSTLDLCPWCGEDQTDLWDLNLRDGDITETECGSCLKKIKISCCIDVSYDITRCDDNPSASEKK